MYTLEYNGEKYKGDTFRTHDDGSKDVDFEGHYMLQILDDKPTGVGMDGGGYPLDKTFFDNALVKGE